MEAGLDPVEWRSRAEALARTLTTSEPLAIGVGMLSVREGRLGRFGETHSVTIALAPPNLVLQRIEDLSFALIDPPLTISRDEIKNVSCTEMGIGVELKVKLAAGPQVKLVLLSGEIYGDSGTTELRAKTTAAGDAITAWLKNPS